MMLSNGKGGESERGLGELILPDGVFGSRNGRGQYSLRIRGFRQDLSVIVNEKEGVTKALGVGWGKKCIEKHALIRDMKDITRYG